MLVGRSNLLQSVTLRPVGPHAAGTSPIAFIDGVTTAGTNGDVTSAAINSTGANFLVALGSYFGGGSNSIVDSKSNTWTPGTLYTDTVVAARVYYCVPSSVGSGHTVTFTGSLPSVGFAAFSNVNASPFDNEVGATGSSTSVAGGSITPSANGGLIIAGMCGLCTTGSIDSSFNLIGSFIDDVVAQNVSLGMAYLIQTSAGAVNPTWTTDVSNQWAATNAAFKN